MAQQQQMEITGAAGKGVAQGVAQAAGAATQQMAPQVIEQAMGGAVPPMQGGPM